MKRRMIYLSWIAGLSFIAVLGGVNPVSGTPIALVDNDGTSANAHYSTDQNANIGVSYSSTDVGAQQGTLTINTTWGAGDFATRSILFEQTEVPAVPPDGFLATQGLRLQFELSLGNSTGLLWNGFDVSLEDDSVPASVGTSTKGGEGSHLFKAHFHPNLPGGISIAGGLTTANAFNNTTLIELSGGTSGNLILTNFFLHERNLTDADDKPVLRKFTLFLTPHPVPEPTTMLLLGLGLMGLAGIRRKLS